MMAARVLRRAIVGLPTAGRFGHSGHCPAGYGRVAYKEESAMTDKPDSDVASTASDSSESTEARRDFMRKAAKMAITTPAVSLLLAAGTRPRALAQPVSPK